MITTAILAALVPGAVAAALLAVAFRVWRRGDAAGPDRSRSRARAALPVALMGGFASGYALLRGWPSTPPVEANEYLFFVLAAVALLAVADVLWTAPAAARLAVRALVSVAVPWVLFQQMLEHTWTGANGWLWIAVLGAALFALWTGLEALAARVRGPSLPVTWLVVATGTSGALLASGNALMGQLAGTIAAGLGAVFLLALLRRDLSVARGATPMVAVGVAGLTAIGTIYGELPLAAAALVLVAFLAPWLVQLGPLRRLGTWAATALRAGLAALALAAAVYLAVQPPPAAPSGANDPGYEYDYDYSNIPE